MESRNLRGVKLAVMIAFLTLTGYVVSQRASFADPLTQTSKLKNPLQPTETNIALGLDHFDAHCASCHGLTGKADIEKGKLVAAADLTSDKVQSQSDSELFRTISEGVPFYAGFRQDAQSNGDLAYNTVPAEAANTHRSRERETRGRYPGRSPAQPRHWSRTPAWGSSTAYPSGQ